jgi:type IV pilus assembly protein PilY1
MMKKILLQAFIFWALIAPELGAQTFPAFGIIYNSTIAANRRIALGVNPQGHLNAGSGVSWTKLDPPAAKTAVTTGISYKYTDGFFYDATSPGCLCEGWGASAIDQYGVGVTGYANISSGGIANITVKSFVVDQTSIVSTVWINDSKGAPMLEVTHKYGPSTAAPDQLFQALVTITNISGASVTDVRYKRAMDWDISPDAFYERVEHYGVVNSRASPNFPRLLWASDNGFDVPNALNNTASSVIKSTINTDFSAGTASSGPADHGSVFTFQFGDLVCGDSSILYCWMLSATNYFLQNYCRRRYRQSAYIQ